MPRSLPREAIAPHPLGPVRVQFGERDELPNICGRCGEPRPSHTTVLRMRKPVLVDGAIVPRTQTVPIRYCSLCYGQLNRFHGAVRRLWTVAWCGAAVLLAAQLLLPRSDDVLALRDALPFAALALVGVALLFQLVARSLSSARRPVRLIDFGVGSYTLAFDNPDVALAFERANRPTPIAQRGP